jgi:heme O synthase-like polyprenyltransferase
VLATLALATHASLGWLYLVTAGLASTGLLALSALLIGQPGKKRALALFHGSNLYLGLLILVICVEAALA